MVYCTFTPSVLTMNDQFGGGSRTCIGKNVSHHSGNLLVKALLTRIDLTMRNSQGHS